MKEKDIAKDVCKRWGASRSAMMLNVVK